MINQKELNHKIIKSGAYYIAQVVDTDIYLLLDENFSEDEMAYLEDKGLTYVENLIEETYNTFEDLNEDEVDAIKNGLKEYKAYGLINDWSLNICDYEFDDIMLEYIDNKEMDKVKLYNKLYATVLQYK